MNTKTILLIDDDDDDKFIFNEVIQALNLGYECIFASDGFDGLRILNNLTHLPDYIFIDLNMPKMGGKQCLTEIKREQKFAEVPVIIYSTSKLEGDDQETRMLGASYFLTKPGLFTELQQAIFNVLTGQVAFNNVSSIELRNFK